VGKNLPTAREERINVHLTESDAENSVVIES
jgi:pyrimidine operon attenuation protein/uracil phosphoribosyltransferase